MPAHSSTGTHGFVVSFGELDYPVAVHTHAALALAAWATALLVGGASMWMLHRLSRAA